MAPKRDLSLFTELNKEVPKVDWDLRYGHIKEMFPSAYRLNWDRIFDQDPTILGTIINDIIKASVASPKRPGKRGAVEKQVALDQLKQLAGDDYSIDPFAIAFTELKGEDSIRVLAAKTGLDRNYVYRLLRGEIEPDLYALEQVAKAYDKKPEYFLEYRVRWILSLLIRRLERSPESSIVSYRKLNKIGKYA